MSGVRTSVHVYSTAVYSVGNLFILIIIQTHKLSAFCPLASSRKSRRRGPSKEGREVGESFETRRLSVGPNQSVEKYIHDIAICSNSHNNINARS